MLPFTSLSILRGILKLLELYIHFRFFFLAPVPFSFLFLIRDEIARRFTLFWGAMANEINAIVRKLPSGLNSDYCRFQQSQPIVYLGGYSPGASFIICFFLLYLLPI
jgi:hypothetical protein